MSSKFARSTMATVVKHTSRTTARETFSTPHDRPSLSFEKVKRVAIEFAFICFLLAVVAAVMTARFLMTMPGVQLQ